MLAAGDVNGDYEVTRADAMELARDVDGWKTTYTVTFEANADGVVGMPENQEVVSGKYAVKPAEPTKDGDLFLTRYEDKYETEEDFPLREVPCFYDQIR